MPNSFKRVAVDAFGNADSILGPLRQKSFPDHRMLLRRDAEMRDETGQSSNQHDLPGKEISKTGITISPEQEVEKTDSKYATQGTSRTSSKKRQSQVADPNSKKSDGASALSAERGNNDKAAHIVAAPFPTSRDDVNSVEHTAFPLPPDQAGCGISQNSQQNVPSAESMESSGSERPDITSYAGKEDQGDQRHSSVNATSSKTDKRQTSVPKNVPSTESMESSGSERPDITSYAGKEYQGDQRHSLVNPTSSKTDNRQSSVPETVRESHLSNQTVTGKPDKTKADSNKMNIMTITPPRTGKDNDDKQAVQFDQASVYSRNDQREFPFHDSSFQNEPGLAIDSREPLVHIGQIDVIIEAPLAPTSNKATRRIEVNQSLNASASFLRRL